MGKLWDPRNLEYKPKPRTPEDLLTHLVRLTFAITTGMPSKRLSMLELMMNRVSSWHISTLLLMDKRLDRLSLVEIKKTSSQKWRLSMTKSLRHSLRQPKLPNSSLILCEIFHQTKQNG